METTIDTIALNRMVKACNIGPGFTKGIEELSNKSQKKIFDAVVRRYERTFNK